MPDETTPTLDDATQPPNLDGGIAALVEALFDPAKLTRLQRAIGNGVAYGVTTAHGATVGAADGLGEKKAGLLEQLENGVDSAIAPLLARLVSHLLGVEVPASALSGERLEDGGSAIGAALSKVVVNLVEGPSGELKPGTEGSSRVIGALASLTLKGWFEGVIIEELTSLHGFIHPIEKISELGNEIISHLGLTRLASQVLRPIAAVTIRTPATWAMNKKYRPKMLSVPEAIHAWFRGDIDEATVDEIAARDGYGDDAIAALKHAAQKTLSIADMRLLVKLGYWQQQDAIDELRLAGHDEARAQLLWNVEDARDLWKQQHELADAAAAAYVDRKIDESKLMDLIGRTSLDTLTQNRIHELASQRRLVNVLHLTRGDVVQAVKLKTLSVSDYGDWLKARGYADDDALTLELNLRAELENLDNAAHLKAVTAAARAAARAAKDQAATAKRDQVAAEHAHWTGTLGQAERLVVRGLMPALLYRQILIDHAIASADADELVAVATQDRDARAAQLAKRAAGKAAASPPAVPLGTLLHAILIGARSIDTLAPAMRAAGYTEADITLEQDLIRHELADRAAAAAARAVRAPAGTTKALTLAQLERAVLDGVGTLEQYRAALITAGFGATDTALLVADMSARLEQRSFADARHALAEEKFAASQLSLAQEEKAVVDGILTLADYQQFLAAHGFDADDQAILVALLELKLPAV